MARTELIQKIQEKNESCKIAKPLVDGPALTLLKKHMLEAPDATEESVGHIVANACKVLQYLIDPRVTHPQRNKILCLGKVQSGKTAFFISAIALAFDNGYNLAYVIGGTKTKLKNQNYDRLLLEFENNPNVKIVDIAQKDHEDPQELLQKGYKVVIVALKNVAEKANLGVVNSYSVQLKDYPSIIVDDEGDECSPGAPKSKAKNPRAGRTHDVITDIVNNINVCTFLSVTATPQANFLLSTMDELSPDFALLVEPGSGYTGGNAFHDTYDNKHVIEIKDSDQFGRSIPESFKRALNFFIGSMFVQYIKGDKKKYSMLIHPSSLTKVQNMVVEKINDHLTLVKKILSNEKNIAYDDLMWKIYSEISPVFPIFGDVNAFKKTIRPVVKDVLSEINIFQFNVSEKGREDIKAEDQDKSQYKIYVGGNMLGRGLTIKNLCVTYIYRDSKITQIDTLYQRARWFGYKRNYFNFCRVYMTPDLKRKFIDTVENENDMWNSMNAFLLTKTDVKFFPRLFTLNNDKLRLTRNTVSKTVVVERINPGYAYDKSIAFSSEQLLANRELYNNLLKKYKNIGINKQFGRSKNQQHLIVEMKFSDFYNEFLKNYAFPRGSKFGLKSFNKIKSQIDDGAVENSITVIFMRYKNNEQRTPIANGYAIKELPQSYDNGTGYPGDKKLDELEKKLHIQLHPVYLEEGKNKEIIPLIALNNPITSFNVRYVTGDNYYEVI